MGSEGVVPILSTISLPPLISVLTVGPVETSGSNSAEILVVILWSLGVFRKGLWVRAGLSW